MLADYFTKPLQGSLFKKLRNYVMGTTVIPDEERVETNINYKDTNQAPGITVENNDGKRSYANVVMGKKNTVVKNTGKKLEKIIANE